MAEAEWNICTDGLQMLECVCTTISRRKFGLLGHPSRAVRVAPGSQDRQPIRFGAYNEQLERFYSQGPRPWLAELVGDAFNPTSVGDWFHNSLSEWSKSLPKGHATAHVFRKTSLQHARSGEDVNRKVAEDARVSESVMMTHHVEETEQELRNKSNRTYHRILASLAPSVAQRYGYVELENSKLERRLKAAVTAKNWSAVAKLTAQLAKASAPKDPDFVNSCEQKAVRIKSSFGERRNSKCSQGF
jgi:hypothetical protein